MNRIIFATGNAGKMKEIREILGDMDAEILSMKEAGIQTDIVENGTTFEENARIKAKAVAQFTKDIVLADDSGLEVDYLNKEPGVYSARYMGEDTSYTIKNQAILDRLKGVPKEKRTARFVCAIAAAMPNGDVIFLSSLYYLYLLLLGRSALYAKCNSISQRKDRCLIDITVFQLK